MKKYTNENPEFSETLNIVETSDPAHADKINDAPKQLLQNTLVNSKSIGELRVTVKEQASPTFDDSGETEAISSFEDFKSSIKSKMKIVDFFRNLKAGLKYVLHVGALANNCVSDNPNLPLAAAQGKVLQDQINVLNANKQNSLALPETENPNYSNGMYPPNGGWVTREDGDTEAGTFAGYYNLKMGWILLQFRYKRGHVYLRSRYGNTEFSEWKLIA